MDRHAIGHDISKIVFVGLSHALTKDLHNLSRLGYILCDTLVIVNGSFVRDTAFSMSLIIMYLISKTSHFEFLINVLSRLKMLSNPNIFCL